MVADPEAVANGGREQSGAGSGSDEGEPAQREADGAPAQAAFYGVVDAEILHGGIEELLDDARQAVDLVDEENFPLL